MLEEMGTGRIIQVINYINENKEVRPVIIICELRLKQYWLSKCNKTLDTKDIQVIDGFKPVSITGNVIILDYFIYWKHREALLKVNPQLIVLDETLNSKTGMYLVKR